MLEGRYGVILTVKSPSKEEIRLGFSIYLSFDLFGSLLGREALKAFILKAFSVSLIGFESRTGHQQIPKSNIVRFRDFCFWCPYGNGEEHVGSREAIYCRRFPRVPF